MAPDFENPQLVRRVDWLHDEALVASYQQVCTVVKLSVLSCLKAIVASVTVPIRLAKYRENTAVL